MRSHPGFTRCRSVSSGAMRIRLAKPEDGRGTAAIYDPVVTESATSFESEPPGPEGMAGRISAAGPFHPWLVAEDSGAVSGFAYAGRHRIRGAYGWAVDVSVYVDPRYQRRGVGRSLYQALFGVLEAQGYWTAHAGISLPNPSSVAFHESMGFEPIGVYPHVGWKLGRWHDVGWWQRRLRSGDDAPSPLLPVTDVDVSPVLAKVLAQTHDEPLGGE